jgi:hypothetical protein
MGGDKSNSHVSGDLASPHRSGRVMRFQRRSWVPAMSSGDMAEIDAEIQPWRAMRNISRSFLASCGRSPIKIGFQEKTMATCSGYARIW